MHLIKATGRSQYASCNIKNRKQGETDLCDRQIFNIVRILLLLPHCDILLISHVSVLSGNMEVLAMIMTQMVQSQVLMLWISFM